jgi:hypothetical protein
MAFSPNIATIFQLIEKTQNEDIFISMKHTPFSCKTERRIYMTVKSGIGVFGSAEKNSGSKSHVTLVTSEEGPMEALCNTVQV